MILYYFLMGAFSRRWYGGALEKIPVLNNRALQTGFMIGLFLNIYVADWHNWFWPLVISLWLQFQFWSRQHGVCFDLSRGGYPDETTLKRYNNYWWHIPCDWMADKGFYPYYGLGYDFTYMLLRYTCPMIPMMFFDWKYILIGLAISPIYLFCWEWYESKVFPKNIPFVSRATQMAEVICGGLVFMGCYLLGL